MNNVNKILVVLIIIISFCGLFMFYLIFTEKQKIKVIPNQIQDSIQKTVELDKELSTREIIDSILILENKNLELMIDGLYLVDIRERNRKRIFSLPNGNQFDFNSHLIISHNKKILTLERESEILIFVINDWRRLIKLDVFKTVKTNSSHISFSLDDKYLIITGDNKDGIILYDTILFNRIDPYLY